MNVAGLQSLAQTLPRTDTRWAPAFAYPASATRPFTPVDSSRDRDLFDDVGDPARILIVEDHYLAASEIEDVLREAGYQIVGIADTAHTAVQLAQSKHPTLIIMDIRLIGRADGVDAA